MKTKSLFDFLLALALLPIFLPFIGVLILVSTIDTRQFGLFIQVRIGKNAKQFKLYKIRSMRGSYNSYVTSAKTHKITKFGRFIRKTKLDELPQIFNILIGDMSFVGPRPDVVGYADRLTNEDRIILNVKPGITGPAQLAFKNEEELLEQQENPQKYNEEVLWPHKVMINKEYVQNYTFFKDLKYILKTIF
ncbi:MAG: sugar transferase [Moheibacter sp.]